MNNLSRRVAGATVLAMGLAAITIAAPVRAQAHGPIAWTESPEEAKRTAIKEKKLIMMDFWAIWCGPCKKMLNTTYKDKEVVERSKKFVPLLVNADKQPALVKKYDIGTIPQVLFVDSKGAVVAKGPASYLDAKALLALMDDATKHSKR